MLRLSGRLQLHGAAGASLHTKCSITSAWLKVTSVSAKQTRSSEDSKSPVSCTRAIHVDMDASMTMLCAADMAGRDTPSNLSDAPGRRREGWEAAGPDGHTGGTSTMTTETATGSTVSEVKSRSSCWPRHRVETSANIHVQAATAENGCIVRAGSSAAQHVKCKWLF